MKKIYILFTILLLTSCSENNNKQNSFNKAFAKDFAYCDKNKCTDW